MYVKLLQFSPMTHFMKVYFHMCQNLFTAYFQKILSFEMHSFIKLLVSACFPTIIKTHPIKKRTFYSVFGSVIAVLSLSPFCPV